MHLVSGDCRLAFVLYRLYLAWPKRYAGAAAKVLFGSPPRSQHHECEIEVAFAALVRDNKLRVLSPFARAGSRTAQLSALSTGERWAPHPVSATRKAAQMEAPAKKCRFEIEQRRGDTNDTKSSARDILTIPMRFKLAMSPDRRWVQQQENFRCVKLACS